MMLSQSGIYCEVPDILPELSARKRELEMMTEYDPDIYPELWRALAEEFEEIGYIAVAERCRKYAAHYAKSQ